MNYPRFVSVVATLALVAPNLAAAATLPNLGTAANFLAVADSSFTSSGATTIYGDIATSPGSTVSVLSPGKIIGSSHANDAIAMQAKSDLTAAYDEINLHGCDYSLASNFGGQTYSPGIYCANSYANLLDRVSLDAYGDPNAVFIFKIKNHLIVGDGAEVKLANGAKASNIFWHVGGYAIVGSGADLQGTLLANNTVEVKEGATVKGRIFSKNDGISLNRNVLAGKLADMTVEASVDKTEVAEGDRVMLTVRVTNSGPDESDNLTVKVILPENVDYVSASPTRGEHSSGIWSLGRLDPLNSGILNISVKARAGTVGQSFAHSAELMTASTIDPDSTAGNGISTEDDYSSASFMVAKSGASAPTTDPTVSGVYSPTVASVSTPDVNVDKGLKATVGLMALCVGGTLIKGSLAAVYYCGADGRRYVFPNQATYLTWYSDFSRVMTIPDITLAQIMIGGNVTYHPGIKMVKVVSDPRVYVVSRGGTLRQVGSETIAKALYGDAWNKKIDDVSDAFFVNYKLGEPITSL